MMERLTKRDKYGSAFAKGVHTSLSVGTQHTPSIVRGDIVNRLAAYEDTGLEPEEVAASQRARGMSNERFLRLLREDGMRQILETLEKYKGFSINPEKALEYQKAKEEGRLVVLPCKVGDMVYYIDGGKSYKSKAVAFRINESGLRVYCERNFMGHIGFEGVYGITVFLTREEAEAALKEE